MAKVCEEWFPWDKEKGISSFKGQRSPGFYMHPHLKETIDLWVKNVDNDWDFVIIISGQGTVRVGKSVLAQQIAAYWTYAIWKKYGILPPFDIKNNIVFHGSELIRKGNRLGKATKYGALIFDEAGADLEGAKAMRKTTQNVKDFFRECGQYNMLNILCIPEYFDLPKGIATNRSNCLIDCYVTTNDEDIWERGKFNFFSAPNKKKLYRIGKKELDYHCVQPDYYGDWDNVYTVDQEEYKAAKVEALKTREVVSRKEETQMKYLRGALKVLYFDFELTYSEIAEKIAKQTKAKVSKSYLHKVITGEELDEDDIED